MLKTINYKGYTIKERESICEDIDNYWTIYKNLGNGAYKWIIVANSLKTAKVIIDERIKNGN